MKGKPTTDEMKNAREAAMLDILFTAWFLLLLVFTWCVIYEDKSASPAIMIILGIWAVFGFVALFAKGALQ